MDGHRSGNGKLSPEHRRLGNFIALYEAFFNSPCTARKSEQTPVWWKILKNVPEEKYEDLLTQAAEMKGHIKAPGLDLIRRAWFLLKPSSGHGQESGTTFTPPCSLCRGCGYITVPHYAKRTSEGKWIDYFGDERAGILHDTAFACTCVSGDRKARLWGHSQDLRIRARDTLRDLRKSAGYQHEHEPMTLHEYLQQHNNGHLSPEAIALDLKIESRRNAGQIDEEKKYPGGGGKISASDHIERMRRASGHTHRTLMKKYGLSDGKPIDTTFGFGFNEGQDHE